MAITGYLSEFSLAEIFQFLDRGQKTGLLAIHPLLGAQESQRAPNHYIWFNQGRIVSAANRLDGKGLLALINQRGWASDRVAGKVAQICSADTPLGLCLKSQGLLDAEQIKLLFYIQVMRQVCALFKLNDGKFLFNHKVARPVPEMTGLSMPATEVTLAGLRALRDWQALQDKLPEPTSSLISLIRGKPHLHINQMEWRIWEFTNGTISLNDIAAQLQLPLEKVQQIAFRLMVVGLAEEMPMVVAPMPESSAFDVDPTLVGGTTEHGQVSQSFLDNLVGFLKGKG